MIAKSINIKSVDELQGQIDKLKSIDNLIPTLSICFCHPDFGIDQIIKTHKHNNIQLIGCTTSGEICNDGTFENSASFLFLDTNPEYFKITGYEYEDQNAFDAGQKISKDAHESFSNPALLVYSGGLTIDGEQIITGLNSIADKPLQIYGGQAGDYYNLSETIVFDHNSQSNNKLVAVVFDADHIHIEGVIYSGWNEMGREHIITKCENNYLYEIDNKPALEQFTKYFGDNMFEKEEGSDSYFTVPGQYPLRVFRDNGKSFMRGIVLYDLEEKSLILAGGVKTGDRFKFCPTPSLDVVQKTVESFESFHRILPDVEAMILNSCASRYFAFGPAIADEVSGIYNIWKKPMAGYMSYGEFGNTTVQDPCAFHNVSCALVTLREK